MTKLWIGVLILGIAGIVGCGRDDGPERVPVTGEVTIGGKPLPDGDIIFRQTTPEGFTDAGTIKDGKYEITAVVGKYTVEISAMREVPGTAKTLQTGETGSEMEQFVPEKYNDKTILKAEVTESGENKFDFPLDAK